MNNNITVSNLKSTFQSYLQSSNAKINPYAINSSWDILSIGISSIMLDLYSNLSIIQNSIFPQNLVGDQINEKLYSLGLPSRVGATYSSVICIIPTLTTTVTIPPNTIFNSSGGTPYQFQTIQEWTITTNTEQIVLYSLIAGNQQYINSNNMTLTNETYGALQINNLIIGQNEESDQSAINRILIAIRTPTAGSRQTDYQNYCILASSQVTDSIIIPNWYLSNAVGVLGIFPLTGTTITDYTLDQGLISGSFIPYNRVASSDIIISVSNYIQSLRLVGLTPSIKPNHTFVLNNAISPSIKLNVSLLSGYTLSTILKNIPTTDANNNPTTADYNISQLIQKELRRLICNQPYGATNINGTNFITIDNLITGINNQLNSKNGQIAQILTNISFNIGDIKVPSSLYQNNTSYLQYTYDIPNYSFIVIEGS